MCKQSKEKARTLFINKKILDRYNIISFDVFDTLLKRQTLKPSDVFLYEERILISRYGDIFSGFKDRRLLAERKAREKSENGECTLKSIYQELFADDWFKGNTEIIVSECSELEENLELKICIANKEIQEVFNYCKNKGKKIFCISDMYLRTELIAKMLINVGYEVAKEQIYVSNKYGVNKKSGKLFEIFLKCEGISPSSVLHIGDSKYADFIGPAIVGIKAVHIPRYIENYIYPAFYKKKAHLNLDERTLKTVINNTSKKFENRYEKIGCECFSPIVIGYTLWLRERAREKKIKKYVFLARDGYLFYEAYKKYFQASGTSVEYAYISRNSVRLTYFNCIDNFEDICVTFPTQNLTIYEILASIGFDSTDFKEIILANGIKSSERFNMRDPELNQKVAGVLSFIHKNPLPKYRMQSEMAVAYMKQAGLFEDGTAVVDIGWHGSLQVMIEKIVCFNKSVLKPFYYYGSLKGSANRLHNFEYYHYALSENNGFDEISLIYFMERFMPEYVGSTKEYYKEVDTMIVRPLLDNVDYSDFEIGQAIQRGCIEGVTDFFDLHLPWRKIEGNNSYLPLLSLTSRPKMIDAISIGNIEFFDGIPYNMAKPDRIRTYIKKPHKLIIDLKKSRWREAFFLRMFKIHLPWIKIFTILKKIYMVRRNYK